MVRLENTLESWKTIRADVAAAVEDLPSDLDFRPVDDLMTFRELATHILQAGHGLTGLLLAGDENLATPDFREKIKRHAYPLAPEAGASEIAAALRMAVEERLAELSRQTPEFYAQVINRFDNQRVTRLEMVQMVKEHELTHRSQMFTYLRLKGIVPPTTRRRMKK